VFNNGFANREVVCQRPNKVLSKTMGARSKINAISLNVKINKRKSVDVCGYKLPINVLNFMQKKIGSSENIVESRGGNFF